MDSDAYTPNAICQAMGLEPYFIPDVYDPALRVLLCPSFAVEVCISFVQRAPEQLRVEVTCPDSQIWHLDQMRPVRVRKEVATLGNLELDDLEREFRLAVTEMRGGGWVSIDGMPIHLTLWGGALSVHDNPRQGTALARYIGQIISTAHAAISDPNCRNALATAAKYVGLELALDETAIDAPAVTRIAVLGDSEETSEVPAALAQVSSNRRPEEN